MKKNINRRQFLQTSGLAIAGAAVAGTTGTLLLDPSATWAVAKATLDDHTTKTLVVMCRQIYPHTVIEDAEYAKTVEGFTKKASTDPSLCSAIARGCCYT